MGAEGLDACELGGKIRSPAKRRICNWPVFGRNEPMWVGQASA